MTAENGLDRWPWLTGHGGKTRAMAASKRRKHKPQRKHAGWTLELALLLALALLLPRPRKRK
jgi:hypothetical protein